MIYVKAIHDYLPTTSIESIDESVSCLFFEKGSIIQVFNKDDSGWWDGQCGNNRGWFPSNYVELSAELNVSHDDFSMKRKSMPDISISMEILTKRVTDLVNACNHPSDLDIQLYTSRIVSSIKSVLVECNMINKDSYLLKSHPDLGKQRKIILIALNRLITKSKELQQAENLEREQKQVSIFASELMNAINHLTKILSTIPRRPLSNITDSTVESQRSSCLFDTPRSSVSSHSCSNSSLRQYLTETRHSSLPIKPNYPTDKQELLQLIMDYQSNISKLIEKLKISFTQYLENRHHATVILDITRKVMEAVMTYLSAVEHVCSNMNDSSRAFTIPKDPSHVTLLITKESVYSAITNLVTATRSLDSLVYSCCEGVLKSTNECTASIKACLEHLLHMQELSEKDQPLIQQHINRQPLFHHPVPPPQKMYKRLSMTSSKESFDSSKDSFDSSFDSTNSSFSSVSTIPEDLPPLPPNKPPLPNVNFYQPPKALKARLSRGLSVSSLRSSFSRSKLERSEESIRLPSWMVKNSIDISAPFISNQVEPLDKEPDYLFLKKYAFENQDMILNADGEVIGATVESLVQRLTLHEKSSDPEFVRAFFYTFRLFSSPIEFLTLLIDRYNLQAPRNLSQAQSNLWTNRVLIPIRFRVYHVLKTWLQTYFDQDQDFCIKDKLLDFISNDMSKVMPGPAKRMIELSTKTFHTKGGISYATLKRSVSTSMHHNSISKASAGHLFLHKFEEFNEYPQPILGKALKSSFKKHSNFINVHVNRIHSVELARQLTLMENYLFCQIQANEMIGQEFKKKTGTSHALHVKAMIQKSTQITCWVSDTILKEKDVKKRSNILKHWIKVGDACLQFNNYNTLMAIRSALDSASIIRLKKTWDCLSLKHKTMWETIHRATDSTKNFAEYRHRLRAAVAPCLPFLGIYLTDMTFIDDGNPDSRTSPANGKQLVNFNKYVKMAKILNEIHQFQVPYKFIEVEEIQRYIKVTLQKVEQDDQLFYSKSLQREPKEEES